MDSDLALVVGSVILGLGFPAIVSAYSYSQPPRAAMLCFVVGGGLVAYAMSHAPGGYDFADMPRVFASVVGRYVQ